MTAADGIEAAAVLALDGTFAVCAVEDVAIGEPACIGGENKKAALGRGTARRPPNRCVIAAAQAGRCRDVGRISPKSTCACYAAGAFCCQWTAIEVREHEGWKQPFGPLPALPPLPCQRPRRQSAFRVKRSAFP